MKVLERSLKGGKTNAYAAVQPDRERCSVSVLPCLEEPEPMSGTRHAEYVATIVLLFTHTKCSRTR